MQPTKGRAWTFMALLKGERTKAVFLIMMGEFLLIEKLGSCVCFVRVVRMPWRGQTPCSIFVAWGSLGSAPTSATQIWGVNFALVLV